jgi:hypothetical protein
MEVQCRPVKGLRRSFNLVWQRTGISVEFTIVMLSDRENRSAGTAADRFEEVRKLKRDLANALRVK